MDQTLDALDGKQARRTGTSSPLGELFDHGCDALTTTLMTLTVLTSMQLGTGYIIYFLLVLSLMVFYFAQWEEYQSGVLDLGIMNVTEIQLMVMGTHLLTFFFGPPFWLQSITIAGHALEFRHLFVIPQVIGVFVTSISNFIKVNAEIKKRNFNVIIVYAQLIPLAASMLFSTLWVLKSPTKMLFTHPLLFLVGFGFILANFVGKLVLTRVCKEEFSWIQPLVLLFVFGYLNAIFKEALVSEEHYLIFFLLASIVAYLHFALWVIQALCLHLDINCLSIKQKKKN